MYAVTQSIYVHAAAPSLRTGDTSTLLARLNVDRGDQLPNLPAIAFGAFWPGITIMLREALFNRESFVALFAFKFVVRHPASPLAEASDRCRMNCIFCAGSAFVEVSFSDGNVPIRNPTESRRPMKTRSLRRVHSLCGRPPSRGGWAARRVRTQTSRMTSALQPWSVCSTCKS